MVRKALKRWITHCIAALYFLLPVSFADSKVLYRYVDEDGVKVLNHSIPPEYAQKGYEIISPTGQVLEVIEPAPTESEIAAQNADRQLKERFAILKRRYSSLDDIESAKIRRLKNINTNISILRGNIGSINIRIENLMNKAAEMERAGKEVSALLLQQLTDARAELTVAESALDSRLQEYQSVSDRFDKDLATFIKGSEVKADSLN